MHGCGQEGSCIDAEDTGSNLRPKDMECDHDMVVSCIDHKMSIIRAISN